MSNHTRKSLTVRWRNFSIHLNSDHVGKIIGNHIPIQSSTFANGLYSYINGRVLVPSDHNIGYTSIQYTLFSVIVFLTIKFMFIIDICLYVN